MDALSELKALSVLGHMFLLWSPACYSAEQRIIAGLMEFHIQHNLGGKWEKKQIFPGFLLTKEWAWTWIQPSFAAPCPDHKA